MIIDFTVSNFRSIKDEQTFSLYVQTPGEHLPENVSYPAGDKIGILKSAGLYGANASGKSNMLYALYALQYIIVASGDLKDGDVIPCYEPYLLAEGSKSLPTCFEIEFFVPHNEESEVKPLRYRYCVMFTANKILEESLVFYPSVQQAVVFERKEEDTWRTIKFGTLYKGGKRKIPFFANNAYLSKSGDSADTPPMIRDIYNYFRKDLTHLGINEVPHKLNWLEDIELVNKVAFLLSSVDTGISNIHIKESVDTDEIKFPANLPDDLKSLILKDRKYAASFLHLTETGSSEIFEAKQESTGTQKLFNLAPLIFETLSKGGVLIIDELDNSMHPFMAELIIKLFNDPRINKGNAQLIFSTHNINLMSPELLRRDQIWFTEKQQGATRFYSLDDFDKKKVKPQSPFNQWYAEGRFGAVPAINYQGIVDLFNPTADSDAQNQK
jgi:AAA15 family ATPase/GTPase